jgi:TRAP-type C4-dicarboxylate transport system permease small subunit
MADDIDMAALDAARPAAVGPVGLALEAMAAIGTLWTFGLMCLIVADVIGRSFLNAPITGVAEIAAHSVVGIVFLQIGATIHQRRMTRADFLIERLHRTAPAFAHGVETLFLILGAAIMGFIATAGWTPMWNAMAAREFFGVQGTFTVPTWPFRALIVAGGAAGAVAYLALILAALRGRPAGR